MALITPPTAPPKRIIPNGIHTGIVFPFLEQILPAPELSNSAGTPNKTDSNYFHYNFFILKSL
jgi:hypothetical protein